MLAKTSWSIRAECVRLSDKRSASSDGASDPAPVDDSKTSVSVANFPAPTGPGSLAPSELADRLSLDRTHSTLIDHDVFASIYNAGKLALLATWRDRTSAEQFEPRPLTAAGAVRHRVVRIVRDYGMFDRRESPQYYPDIQRGPTPHP